MCYCQDLHAGLTFFQRGSLTEDIEFPLIGINDSKIWNFPYLVVIYLPL